MRCPVCDAENPDTAPECQLCGKELLRHDAPVAPGDPLPGLERTLAEPGAAPADAPPFPELERTAAGATGPLAGVEAIEIERNDRVVPEGAAPYWDTAAPELTADRAADDGVRTPSPVGDGLCSFCGEYSLDALCANCGQRRDRFTKEVPRPSRDAAARTRSGEPVLCPACFARVPAGPRCVECGVPFPPALGGAGS